MSGLRGEHPGGLRRRSETEHRALVGVEVDGGTGEGRGLAGAGWADGQDQLVAPGDGSGGSGLEEVEAAGVDGGRWCRLVRLGVDGEGDDAVLLGDDGVVAQMRQ